MQTQDSREGSIIKVQQIDDARFKAIEQVKIQLNSQAARKAAALANERNAYTAANSSKLAMTITDATIEEFGDKQKLNSISS